MTEQEIYIEAMSRQDPADRRRFLDEHCGDDPALRSRLERLIRHSDRVGDFLEAPPEPLEATEDLFVAEAPGTQIGPYKIREQIGEGGMGAVYVAEQIEPVRRKVALKIIRLGMATRDVIARFEAERQALALMDHPNIAKVLDAGSTDSGRPYFVMELVRGIPITKYCNQERLSIRTRIELFIKVCHAIQHAHQKGIIHRDIKPSNILVTLHDGLPVPRIIDFGIAKATQQPLTDKTIYTLFQQFIGTPAYMSPEQAELSGLDIDTRSDIYSLGVLAYELLTGVTPFDADDLMRSGVDEMRKTIREREPLRPSTRLTREMEATGTAEHPTLRVPRPAIDRDLDWIVMKCLEKDRTRRYPTASDLAMDLTRHLDNEPIVARPPSTLYRFQKAFRRNQLVFSLVAAMAGALLVGTGVSTWQALEARRAHREAEDARLSERRERLKAQAAQELAEDERERADAQARKASESERHARRLLYAADIKAAQQALELNNLGRARRLLDRHRPRPGEEDLRGWEWRYLWQLTRGAALATLTRRYGGRSLSFSPDGARLAVGWRDGRVDLWDVAGRRRVRTLTDGKHPQDARVAFSPARSALATVSGAAVVNLYDLDDGRESILWEAPDGTFIRDLVFSKDGSRVVVLTSRPGDAETSDSSRDEVVVVPVSSSRPEFRFPGTADPENPAGELGPTRLSPDNGRLFVGRLYGSVPDTRYTIQCVDLATGDKLWQTEREQDARLTALDVSSDGRVLASGSGYEDSTIRIWDTATGQRIETLRGHTAFVAALAFTRDGRGLVSASADQTIRIWDTRTWTETRVLRGHSDEVLVMAISAGNLIASTGKDGNLMLWKHDGPEADKGYLRLPRDLWLYRVRMLAHSRLLLLPPGKPPELVDLERDAPPVSLPELGSSDNVLGWDGSWEGSDVACRWDGKNQILVDKLREGTFVASSTITLRSPSRPRGFAYNATRRLVAWTEESSPLSVFVAGLAAPERRIELRSDVPDIFPWRFSDDGRFLAGPCNDQSAARAWDLENGRMVVSIDVRPWDLAFAASGRVLVASVEDGPDHEALFFDLESPERPPRRVPGKDGARLLAVSPDGALVALATFRGVRLYDPVEGTLLGSPLHGHVNSTFGVAFSPDGRRLISTSGGREAVKVWDIDTRQELLNLSGTGSYLYLARWRAGGNVILAGAPFQAWRAPPWQEIKATERVQSRDTIRTE